MSTTTTTEQQIVPSASAAPYEPCEECGAPMDPQQRYCVECAARRGNGANPASRYFAAMSKRARRPAAKPAPKSNTSRAAAVGFFALLPIAVAIGVVVGRSGGGNDDSAAFLKAIENQKAATAGATAGSPTAATAGAAAAKAKAKAKAAAAKSSSKPHEKVVAHTPNGEIHEVTNFHASKKTEEEDAKIVAQNPEESGQNYIKAQQNLPDVVVVP
jgi:hypothetical protein